MQDNEFEKQVRDKLGRMQMEASDTVWQRVENGLGRKRKRRRWLIWLPLSALLMAGAIYFAGGKMGSADVVKEKGDSFITVDSMAGSLVNRFDSNEADPNIKRPDSAAMTAGNQLDSAVVPKDNNLVQGSAGNTSAFDNAAVRSGKGSIAVIKSKAFSSVEIITSRGSARIEAGKLKVKSGTAGTKPNSAKTGKSSFPSGSESNNPELSEQNKRREARPDRKGLAVVPADERDQNNGKKQAINAELHLGTGAGGQKKLVVDSAIKTSTASRQKFNNNESGDSTTILRQDDINADSNKLETKQVYAAAINAKNLYSPEIKTSDALNAAKLPALLLKTLIPAAAWRWGLTAAVGRSGITTGKFNALFYSDVSSAPNYSSGNQGNVPVAKPSVVKPSVSLSLGGYLEHQLEPSTYFKAGVQLTRFATTMLVGTYRAQPIVLRSTPNMADKAIESYYTAEQTRRYTNTYTFIDIPFALGFNFAKRTRMPFAWEIGISPSIMLGSNALHFNQGSSLYYKDNSLFKKSQFALVTSLPVNIYNGHRYTLLLAPTFRYNTSNLFMPEINERKHLLSAGLGISINLKK